MFKIDKIAFSPRKIFWFGIPSIITNDIKTELLKKDILLISNNEKLKNIKNTIKVKRDHTIYIFDIDRIIFENKVIKKNKCKMIREIIEMIEDYVPEKSFIYTKTKDCKIDFYCNKAKIRHKISNIFTNKENILSDIILYILPIFKNEKKQHRDFLRLVFFPYILYEIELIPKSNDSTTIKGYLKDLSYNGISIILFDDNIFSLFDIGSKINLKIFFPDNKKIKINDATVIRKLPMEKLVCLNYDISNKETITKENFKKLSDIIFQYINNFIYLEYKNN